MEKEQRITFDRVIVDIPDILQTKEGEVSHFAIPLLEFLKTSSTWIPFTTAILMPYPGYANAFAWYNDILGKQIEFDYISFVLRNKMSAQELSRVSTNAIVITNNLRYKNLENVVYVDDLLANKERRVRYLIRYLKQVFYKCPRSLIRKAKNNDKEAMEWVVARIKLYLSGLIASLYVQFNSRGSECYSNNKKETIDQIINEKILEAISMWNEQRLDIEKLAFIMVRNAFRASSFKEHKAEAFETELMNCPPDKRIDRRIATKFLSQDCTEKNIPPTEEVNKILDNSLTYIEKRVLDLRLGLNGEPSLKFADITQTLINEGKSYSLKTISGIYIKAIKKLKSSKELQKIWARRTRSL